MTKANRSVAKPIEITNISIKSNRGIDIKDLVVLLFFHEKFCLKEGRANDEENHFVTQKKLYFTNMLISELDTYHKKAQFN